MSSGGKPHLLTFQKEPVGPWPRATGFLASKYRIGNGWQETTGRASISVLQEGGAGKWLAMPQLPNG
jgi:hypothetical protein